MSSSKDFYLIMAIVFIGISIPIVAAGIWFNGDEKENKKTTIVTQNSDINTVVAKFNTHFKVPKGTPEIVWQDPKTGETLSESFIKDSYPKAKHEKAFDILRQEGLRRVYEECRGITKKDNSWSLGYCTYRPAPAGQKG